MMYPFMTLNDNTEIVHSEMKPDGKVKVYIETPDEQYCFRHATCWLPDYKWEDIYHYSDEEILLHRPDTFVPGQFYFTAHSKYLPK